MRHPESLGQQTREFYKELWEIVDKLMAQTEDLTFAELARRACVSPTTIKNLWSKRTRFPHFLTVWKLARACGFSFKLVKRQTIRIRKAS